MITYAPDYYPEFSCIADRCRHSCCIGWEIDIDDDTLALYREIGGALGKRLAENIEETEESACFRLGEHERCPFLNKKGLCDLIVELGEEALCEICTEHPRFRNFYESRTELGLGLCCEEAARLILTHRPKTVLVPLSDDAERCVLSPEETEFIAFRTRIFTLLQDRTHPIAERLTQMLAFVGIFSDSLLADDGRWAEMYRSLEQLDPVWGDRLSSWQAQAFPTASLPVIPEIELALEQLAVYFIYRHLSGTLDDGRREARIAFAVLSCHVICTLTSIEAMTQGSDPLVTLIDIARSYSAEVEYSTENVEALLDEIENRIK